ncbi:MAG: hypothetical protein L0323_21855 [Planctomycetes bacterium]|nr:hypothetical protein [Planctomycetota bacterium]
MRFLRMRRTYGLAVVLAGAFVGREGAALGSGDGPATDGGGRVSLRLPIVFVENRGQWDESVRFLARRPREVARLERDALAVHLDRSTEGRARGLFVRLVFEDARPARLRGEDRQEGAHSFFQGADPSKWRAGLPGFSAVLYEGLYEGIDLRVREEAGRLEYDLVVAPGADVAQVRVRCEGVDGIDLQDDGSLHLRTPLGTLRQSAPVTWRVMPDGARRPVRSAVRLLGGTRFGFGVADAEPDLPLVIDPGLEWSTFVGGTGGEVATGAALDASGNVTVSGWCMSSDFPASPGAYDTTYNGTGTMPYSVGDVMVARLQADGAALVYATYLGGSDNDSPHELAVDGAEAIVSGWTSSSNYPTTPGAFDPTMNGVGMGFQFGGGDLFVSRLNATGTGLSYSTYIGGNDLEYVVAMDLGADGSVTLGGHVHSFDFPVTAGAYSTAMTGGSDTYLTRLNAAGTALAYSTYFGGGMGEEYIHSIRMDAAGEATFGGTTGSPDLPVTPGAFDTTFNGGMPGSHIEEAFVGRMNAAGTTLLWSTFLGGTLDDIVRGVDSHPVFGVTVCGETGSADFPTTPGSFSQSNAGGLGAFLTRFTGSGAGLVFSTYLGGGADDVAEDLAVDPLGRAVVAGSTESPGFPTTAGAFDTAYGGGRDAFVTRTNAAGSGLEYSTFLGGFSFESAAAVDLDATGSALLGGGVTSFDFPTTPGAFDTSLNASADAFATRLDLLPAGVGRFGTSTPGCAGPLALAVTSVPQVGNAAFAITCTNAPPGSFGLFGLSGGALPSPLPVSGAGLWLNPATLLAFPVASTPIGATPFSLPIPPLPSLAGATLYTQSGWADACAPGGISASNALQVVVQP